MNSSYLKYSTLTCTDYSNFGGWKNQINNISMTNLTSDSGSYTCLYGSTLRYDNLVPSGGYVTNNINQLNVSSVSCVNLSSNMNLSTINDLISFLIVIMYHV